jgi:hypothetical protein
MSTVVQDPLTFPPSSFLYESLFSNILINVSNKEPKILSNVEYELINTFCYNLSDGEKRLYVRLFLRNNRFIRLNSIIKSYSQECEDLENVVKNLIKMEFALDSLNHLKDLEEALNLLQKEELKVIGKRFLSKTSSSSKNEMIKSLLEKSKTQKCMITEKTLSTLILLQCKKLLGPLIKLNSSTVDIFKRIHLYYFCYTEWQNESLKDEILTAIVKRKYPSYKLDNSGIFKCYKEFLECIFVIFVILDEEALKIEYETKKYLEIKDYIKAKEIFSSIYHRWITNVELSLMPSSSFSPKVSRTPYFLSKYSFMYVWTRILNLSLSFLNQNQLEEADVLRSLLNQNLYLIHSRGKWWDRLLLIMERYEKATINTIISVANIALQDVNVIGGERQSIAKRLNRLDKKYFPSVQNESFENTIEIFGN